MSTSSRPPEENILQVSEIVDARIDTDQYEAVRKLIVLQNANLPWSELFREEIRKQVAEILLKLQPDWTQTKVARARNVAVMVGSAPILQKPKQTVGAPIVSTIEEGRLTNAHTEYHILSLASAILNEACTAAAALVNDAELIPAYTRDLAAVILTTLHHAMQQNLSVLAPIRLSSVPPEPNAPKARERKSRIDPGYAEQPEFLAQFISQYITFRVERSIKIIGSLNTQRDIASFIYQEIAGLSEIINRHIEFLTTKPETPIYRSLNQLVVSERQSL